MDVKTAGGGGWEGLGMAKCTKLHLHTKMEILGTAKTANYAGNVKIASEIKAPARFRAPAIPFAARIPTVGPLGRLEEAPDKKSI